MSRRRRVRASDIASPNPRKGLLAMALIGIALILILFFKGSFGDSTAGFMEHLTYDPDLELPQSAVEKAAASGAPDRLAPVSAASSPSQAGTVADAGADDAGASDAGASDAGASDAGTSDGGAHDAEASGDGAHDADATDAAMTDRGALDAVSDDAQ